MVCEIYSRQSNIKMMNKMKPLSPSLLTVAIRAIQIQCIAVINTHALHETVWL
jgi:hypothetical protein